MIIAVCIVLEYMDGGSLQKMIDAGMKLSEDNIAVIAYSVLQALIELRNRRIIHRDIKVRPLQS
jgi:serine/threonine protein kinase